MRKALIHWTVVLVAITACRGAAACELMAFSFDREVTAGPVVADFLGHALKNPDGWGVAYYPDKSAVVFKEPRSAANSKLAEFLLSGQPWEAKLLIAHVRRASVGGTAMRNTHPFRRELGGKEYALAHNGTLEGFREGLKLSRFKPSGQTDSEHLLCYLLDRIGEKGIESWNRQSFGWLQRELLATNKLGKLNCVFSDGEYLFAYHDRDGYNRLHYISGPSSLAVFSTQPNQRMYLGHAFPATARGVTIATKPTKGGGWESFAPGSLMVWKDGVRVFPKADGTGEKTK